MFFDLRPRLSTRKMHHFGYRILEQRRWQRPRTWRLRQKQKGEALIFWTTSIIRIEEHSCEQCWNNKKRIDVLMRAPYLSAIVLAVSYARLDVSRKSNCSWGINDKNVSSWRVDMRAIRPRTWSVGDNDCDRKKQRIEPPDKEQTRKKKTWWEQ